MSQPKRFLGGALAGLLVCGLLWGGGFVWFFLDALHPAETPPVADGIVALTGGQGRIEASLKLLAEGRGRQLLISGVAPHATPGGVASRLQPADTGDGIPAALWRHVTLGRHATSTIGNADETAAWARTNAIHSLIVVTAGYHIRRATMEIRRTSPDIALYPYPIQPPALRAPLHLASIRLMATEYDKWIMASLGLTRSARL
jgi:uncharacterized SAM-binding protein YcdF (DUF218 family)